jgi:hypothetical protein
MKPRQRRPSELRAEENGREARDEPHGVLGVVEIVGVERERRGARQIPEKRQAGPHPRARPPGPPAPSRQAGRLGRRIEVALAESEALAAPRHVPPALELVEGEIDACVPQALEGPFDALPLDEVCEVARLATCEPEEREIRARRVPIDGARGEVEKGLLASGEAGPDPLLSLRE